MDAARVRGGPPARRPPIYWLNVVLVSVVGTLITDIMADEKGIPVKQSAWIWGIVLAAVFAAWYCVERSLDVHYIKTTRREVSRPAARKRSGGGGCAASLCKRCDALLRRQAFYWTTILFTFALGTAAGDLISEQAGLGYKARCLCGPARRAQEAACAPGAARCGRA